MPDAVPDGIVAQLDEALAVLVRHLRPSLLAVHLIGSAVDGGLKPWSDIDLLVTLAAGIDAATRRVLVDDLLAVSAPPGGSARRRALEVTVVLRDDVLPWRHPARRLLQFGEWQRADIAAGVHEPAMVDPDLALLLTQARMHGIALRGPAAATLFEAVPAADRLQAMLAALATWRSPADWDGDARNVLLTLARVWYGVATDRIATKDAAAGWAMARLPPPHRALLDDALAAYLGGNGDGPSPRPGDVAGLIAFVRAHIARMTGVAL